MTFHGLTRCGVVAACALALCLFASNSFAGTGTDYTLKFDGDTSAVAGVDDAEIEVRIDADGSLDINGYSWGVCSEDENIEIDEDGIVFGGDLTIGDYTFESRQFWDGGWTVGALTNVISGFLITAEDDVHIYTCTYTTLFDDTFDYDLVTTLEFCDTLGDPAVPVEIITEDSQQISPDTETWDLTLTEIVPLTQFMVRDDSNTVTVNESGTTTAAATVAIDMFNEREGDDVGAFSFGISHDGDKLELSEINFEGTETEGFDPEFSATNTDPDGGPGGTVAVVLSLETGDFSTFEASDGAKHICNFVYDGGDEAADMDVVDLDFSADLGSPAVAIVMSVAGVTIEGVETVSGTVTVDVVTGGMPMADMLALDVDNSGAHDILDGVFLLNWIFGDGDEPVCRRSGDFNEDGSFSAADALDLLRWVAVDGDPPPSGEPECMTVLQEEDGQASCLNDMEGC